MEFNANMATALNIFLLGTKPETLKQFPPAIAQMLMVCVMDQLQLAFNSNGLDLNFYFL